MRPTTPLHPTLLGFHNTPDSSYNMPCIANMFSKVDCNDTHTCMRQATAIRFIGSP